MVRGVGLGLELGVYRGTIGASVLTDQILRPGSAARQNSLSASRVWCWKFQRRTAANGLDRLANASSRCGRPPPPRAPQLGFPGWGLDPEFGRPRLGVLGALLGLGWAGVLLRLLARVQKACFLFLFFPSGRGGLGNRHIALIP